jgi:hypothetical protein
VVEPGAVISPWMTWRPRQRERTCQYRPRFRLGLPARMVAARTGTQAAGIPMETPRTGTLLAAATRMAAAAGESGER